jgi:uncharacterized coiled-coil DUF342 family protein
MAARNRPRVQKDDDAQEERTVWNQISGDLKKIKPINNKAAELAAQIQELEEKMAKSGMSTFLQDQSLPHHELPLPFLL